MHTVLHSEGMAQHTRQRPLDAGWFWSVELGAGLVLILCNFEDGTFDVMHELHSFPASSWFVFCCFLAPFSLYSRSADVFSNKQHKLHVWSEGIFKGMHWSYFCGHGLCGTDALIIFVRVTAGPLPAHAFLDTLHFQSEQWGVHLRFKLWCRNFRIHFCTLVDSFL